MTQGIDLSGADYQYLLLECVVCHAEFRAIQIAKTCSGKCRVAKHRQEKKGN